MNLDVKKLLKPLEELLLEAGSAVMEIYGQDDFQVENKSDGSPLTLADRTAHELITDYLGRLTPDIPILSEESAEIPWTERQHWLTLWLVDPLDGTKEFIKRNGEFTLNIALIRNGKPVLGAVYAPVQKLLYIGCQGQGSYCVGRDKRQILSGPTGSGDVIRLVASRSHMSLAVGDFHQSLLAAGLKCEVIGMGSSLKLCLVAEGVADVYPRFGPTMEWDTAAAQAVVENAGGRVLTLDKEPLIYNKPDLHNPWFLVCAGNADWFAYVR